MTSPFPGIDPFVESQKLWHDFHPRFLAALCDVLSERLPEPYVARIDERLNLVAYTGEEARFVLPDVAAAREESGKAPGAARGGTLTLEPVTIPLQFLEERRERWLALWHGADRRVVTVVELLSPTNKAGGGLREYLAKRNAIIHQELNLVELDFLLSGHRLPLERPLPPSDYYALIARGERRPDCDVYAWSVRRSLPEVPIPLLAPDGDLIIELAPILATVYDRARYNRSLDYQAPLSLPLAPEDRAWAEGLARAAVR